MNRGVVLVEVLATLTRCVSRSGNSRGCFQFSRSAFITAFSCQSVTCAGLRCARVCVMAAHIAWACACVVIGNGVVSCVGVVAMRVVLLCDVSSRRNFKGFWGVRQVLGRARGEWGCLLLNF
jgi:hypothetical protein